jgi:hypothetical protein
MKPLIHLNGTWINSLKREAEEARSVIKEAIEKVHDITVHGRDYYPYPEYPLQYNQALEKKREMISGLVKMLADIEEYQMHLEKFNK